MDATHIHLMLTHFPIVGLLIGICILVYGIFSKNESIQKVALVLFIAMAIIAVPVYLTGEEAEETVEHIAGVSEYSIEEHEELAEKAIWLMAMFGAISLISLIASIKKLSFAKMAIRISLLVSLITFGMFAKVGNLGGQIRHTEIVNDTASESDDHEEDNHPDDDDD